MYEQKHPYEEDQAVVEEFRAGPDHSAGSGDDRSRSGPGLLIPRTDPDEGQDGAAEWDLRLQHLVRLRERQLEDVLR